MLNEDNEKRLANYRIAVALVTNLEKAGKISGESAKLLSDKLAQKYSVGPGSIFIK